MNTLYKIEKYTLYIVVLIFPIVALPIFTNIQDTTKITLLSLITVILLLVKTLKILKSEKLELKIGNFDLAVLIISLSYLISGILKTPNKMEAFFLPGVVFVVLASSFLYLKINQIENQDKKHLEKILFISCLLSSLLVLPNIIGISNYNFNPFGSLTGYLIYNVSLIPISLMVALSEKNVIKKFLYFACLSIVLLTITVTFFKLITDSSILKLPDLTTSWVVAVDSLKESPILGIGPGNYLTAFNRFRPLSYNQGNLWLNRFSAARNYFLTAMTETGFFGTTGFILLILGIIKKGLELLKENKLNSNFFSLITLVILLLLFPASISAIFLLFILLALNNKIRTISLDIPHIIIATPTILTILGLLYFSIRILVAEAKFKTSEDLISQNNAKESYVSLRDTIKINPYVDRYHIRLSHLNLVLAQGLAQKKDLKDEDRNRIKQLIQQSIDEAKLGVALNSERSGNWLFLAQTYQSIMGFAQGADRFAIEAYNQAIVFDPINPNLRISLGGIYSTQGQLDKAIKSYELATIAKPDLANAHYNLGIGYKQKGEIDKSINEMTIVMSLVDSNSNDFQTAKKELENLNKEKSKP